MADTIKQKIEEIKASPDRSLAYSNLLHIHRLAANDPSSMEALSVSSPPLIPVLLSDIHCEDEEIAAQSLKCLGFMLYHPSLVTIFSEEVAGSVLESLAELIVETRMKAICNLGVWCISVQQLGDVVVGPRIDLLLRAVVHALDNPFGSLSTTFEAMQVDVAITGHTFTCNNWFELYTSTAVKMAARFSEKMRDISNIWVPPIYRRLVSNDKKERDMAERCLLKMKFIICPPPPTLSKVVALDLKRNLLRIMSGMLHDFQQRLPMIQAWGWYIRLLGPSSLKNRHLINEMLKIPEQTFTDPDPQVQIASLVTWEQLIDAFLPPQKIDQEMISVDKTSDLLRRIKVLITPLKGIISSRCDISVHSSCLKTWHYLLHKLDISVNQPSVLMTSFWPIIESIFSRGFDSMQNTSLWTSCLDLLDDHILSKVRAGKHEPFAEKSPRCIVDKATAAGSSVNNKGSFKEYPIKWLPWENNSLDFFLKMIFLVLRQGSVITVIEENRKLAFSYSLRIFRSVLQGVEVELKMVSTNYDRIQSCLVTILTFLKEVSENMASKYCDKQCSDFLLVAFQFVEALREELDPSIFASPLYRVSLDLKCIKEMQLSERAENIKVEALRVSSLAYNDMVSPMVYTTILDLCLITQSIQNLLISSPDGISRAVKHIKFLLFSENSLLNLHAAISFLYMHLGEPATGRISSLMMWRIIAKGFLEVIGSKSLSFSKSECYHASCTIVLQLLCYPFVMLLYSPDVSVHKSVSNDFDICLVSTQREIELELMIEVWKSLFDSLRNDLQNKSFLINNHAEGLSQMLIRVLDESIMMEIQGNTQSSLSNSRKTGFLLVFGELVICILKYVQVLYVETSRSEAINQDGSHINNSLGLVARFVKMSVKISKTNPQATNMIMCRVFAALTGLVAHICSKQDVLLFMELISDPLVQWLSGHTPDCGEMQPRSSIVYHLQCLWTQILDCLRRSQPPIIFDSLMLGVQDSLLQASLDHPHLPISDATIAFWKDTYNQNPVLKYPQSLLPVLDKLSRSGRINLQRESQSTFANNNSAGKKVTALSHKRISGVDTVEGSDPSQGCADIMAPGFRRKRLKITRQSSNLRGVKSVPFHELGVFDYREGKLDHRKADALLEKLRRA